MYFGCHRSNWTAWGCIALALAIPIITLIVGAAGGWGCKLTCTEDSDDAVPANEGGLHLWRRCDICSDNTQ